MFDRILKCGSKHCSALHNVKEKDAEFPRPISFGNKSIQ